MLVGELCCTARCHICCWDDDSTSEAKRVSNDGIAIVYSEVNRPMRDDSFGSRGDTSDYATAASVSNTYKTTITHRFPRPTQQNRIEAHSRAHVIGHQFVPTRCAVFFHQASTMMLKRLPQDHYRTSGISNHRQTTSITWCVRYRACSLPPLVDTVAAALSIRWILGSEP